MRFVKWASIRGALDRVAISASAVCMLHCVVTPLLLVAAPVFSSTFMADERFHRVLLIFVAPVSIFALLLGCRRHRDRQVLLLGGAGLLCLVGAGYYGDELFGEVGERAATVASGLILVAGHFRNVRLCRSEECGT